MTILSPANTATAATATEGDVKNFLTNLRAFMAEMMGTDSADKAAALATLGAVLNGSLPKSANYTVVTSDRGRVIAASGGITLNLQAAEALGDGFAFAVWNVGAQDVSIDPNLTETINGGLVLVIKPGKMAMIYCDGTKFVSVGGFSTGPGSGLDADTVDGLHAAAFALAGHNHDAAYANKMAIVAISDAQGSYGYPFCTATRANGTQFRFNVFIDPGGVG